MESVWSKGYPKNFMRSFIGKAIVCRTSLILNINEGKLFSEHQIPVIDDYDIEDEVTNTKRIFSQIAWQK